MYNLEVNKICDKIQNVDCNPSNDCSCCWDSASAV